MSGSNFGDSMGWSRSSGSRKGKRGGGAGASVDKPKQPQRGLGVAQLEKIRLQSEMAEYFNPLHGQQPPSLIHRTASLSLKDARASTSSLSSSSLHATAVLSQFTVQTSFGMAYGERGDSRYGEFQDHIVRSPPRSCTIYGAPHHAHPGVTLPLFAPEESSRLRGHHDRSRSADLTSIYSDNPHDVDLELKL